MLIFSILYHNLDSHDEQIIKDFLLTRYHDIQGTFDRHVSPHYKGHVLHSTNNNNNNCIANNNILLLLIIILLNDDNKN